MKWEKKQKKQGQQILKEYAWSQKQCAAEGHSTQKNVAKQRHVKPGLTVALGRGRLFVCILMRHHEGMLRVKISRRLATYPTALGGRSDADALLISY